MDAEVRDVDVHDDANAAAQGYGGHSMIAPLRRVMVRQPAPPADPEDAARFGYPRPADHEAAVREHAAFRALLEGEGIEVITLDPAAPGQLDSIFTYDPSFTTDGGALLTNPGKELRRPEVDLAAEAFRALGIPILGRIESPGLLEGGDLFWIDGVTLAAGEGYRTNAAGIDQLQIFLRPLGVDVMRVTLPYWQGPLECLHLLSLISPVAERLAVVYLPLLPVPFVELLRARGWDFIEIPDEEFATQGCNILALAPGKVLMLQPNPVTRARLEAAGITVLTYEGNEISHNRAGGPTCLTRPVLRSYAETRAGDARG